MGGKKKPLDVRDSEVRMNSHLHVICTGVGITCRCEFIRTEAFVYPNASKKILVSSACPKTLVLPLPLGEGRGGVE